MRADISKECAEALFEEHSAYVYRLALFLTRSKSLADDITQETFLQVFRKYKLYDTSKPIKPWIYKITLNITRNLLRKQKWLSFIGELPQKPGSDLVESTIMRNEQEKELWQEISELPLKSREIIILHFYSGMKLKEVAALLDIPLGTCKSRLNQALNSLRKRLPENEFNMDTGGDICETV